jgi:hypothetical protein
LSWFKSSPSSGAGELLKQDNQNQLRSAINEAGELLKQDNQNQLRSAIPEAGKFSCLRYS